MDFGFMVCLSPAGFERGLGFSISGPVTFRRQGCELLRLLPPPLASTHGRAFQDSVGIWHSSADLFAGLAVQVQRQRMPVVSLEMLYPPVTNSHAGTMRCEGQSV